MDPQLVTVVIPFTGPSEPVEKALDNTWGNLPKQRIQMAMDRLSVAHFMGIHVLPGTPKHLVFELTLDGSADYVFDSLAKELAPELRALLETIDRRPADIAAFRKSHRCEVGLGYGDITGLSFSGTPGFTVRRIRGEAELAAWITKELAERPAGESAQDKLKHIRARLWKEQHLKWAFEEEALLSETGAMGDFPAIMKSLWPLVRELLWPLTVPPALAFGAGLIGGPLLALGSATSTSLFEGGLLALMYRRFRRAEESDEEDTSLPAREVLAECTRREDQIAQNHLIVFTDLKPGMLRRLSLRLAFFAIRQAATHVFPPGKLSDIGTIHFARWIVLPGTSQMLFLSNYGGSWDSYLEDFIIKAHEGLTGVWSNTVGYPKTSNLFQQGATNGSGFKNWARRQQLPTRFWYSAYPKLTTARIRTHAAIRQGIAAPAHVDEEGARIAAERWLALFGGAAPDTGRSVAAEQVPALVFSGMPKLQSGQAWLLRFESAEQAREWVAQVSDKISYGEDPERTRAFSLAFSAEGLRKLGLDEHALRTFPIAFQENSSGRAHKLGDKPEDWRWGGADKTAVDAIALLYARDDQELEALAAEIPAAPRVYQGPEREVGMMFMCLNADIERQFEFIQQTWMRAPSFHGLNNEVDPLAASKSDVANGQSVMTVPTARGPLVLRNLREFVKVVGSGYFFMPGRRCLAYLASRVPAFGRAQAPSAQAAE